MNKDANTFDVIIIGGSYAGLSAAMALGRALRKVLVLDSGLPCNRQTPQSHNFITQDGEKPDVISAKARAQVLKYETVRILDGTAVSGHKTNSGFMIRTLAEESFSARKLIFATGVRDLMPDIRGFAECWGISVIHCPYCHGYEVRNKRTAILSNGDFAYHYAQLIGNWTNDLTILTNGPSTLSREQSDIISRHKIPVIEKDIMSLEHHNGNIKRVVFADRSSFEPEAVYSRPAFEQHSEIPEMLGCELTDQGLLKVDPFQKTTTPGIFACGDNGSMMRSVANAVATGNVAGAVLNNEMTEEEFLS